MQWQITPSVQVNHVPTTGEFYKKNSSYPSMVKKNQVTTFDLYVNMDSPVATGRL
jgi:hypothetical protein